MKRLTKLILVIVVLLWTLVYGLRTNAYAAVPHLLNYQGRLTDSGGAPLNGAYNLTFKIYDSETAGNLLWEETQSGVVIQKGIFSILLGSVTDLNPAFDKPYFLEIKVGTEVMSPRQRITSAGYAIRAEKAEKIKADSEDTIEGYLSDKVDNLTIKVNTSTHKLYVVSSGQQLFTSSGTFTAPAGVTKVYITAVGGGGGGGGCSGNGVGGGGGGGGGSIKYPVSVVPGNSYTVTIGAGGTGGTAGNHDGNAGSDTTFNSIIVGKGGSGSKGGGAGIGGVGGGGANGSVPTGGGPCVITGGTGGAGSFNGGGGGGSIFGVGGKGGGNSDGYAATEPGGGGGGAYDGEGHTYAGGNGYKGACLVEW